MGRVKGGDNPGRTKGGKGGKAAQRELRSRPRQVHIFTEGKVTEKQYIDLIVPNGQLAVPGRRVAYHIENPTAEGKHRKPLPMVIDAIGVVDTVERDARKTGLKPDDWNWPQVWVLFDRDDHKDIRTAFTKAEQNGIKIAYSHPCFELWRLLHYQNYTSSFGGRCGGANKALREQPGFPATYGNKVKTVSEQKSKTVMADQILCTGKNDRYSTAKQHAQRINKGHVSDDQNGWDPYTDVWRFVEDGLLLSGY